VSPLEPVEPASESQTADYSAEAARKLRWRKLPQRKSVRFTLCRSRFQTTLTRWNRRLGKAGEFNADPANGYFGIKVDPTPNEHYSVDGVINGKPTPETDPDHAEKVRAHLANLGH
jgi:hypothetical protein